MSSTHRPRRISASIVTITALVGLLVATTACTKTTLDEQGYRPTTTTTTERADDHTTDDTAPDDEGTARPNEDEAFDAGDGPQVVLLDAGAEPLLPLRFVLTEGTTQSVVQTMQMTMNISGTGMPAGIDQTIPTITMPFTATVDVVDDHGSSDIEMVYGVPAVGVDGDLDAATRSQLDQQYAAIEGQVVSVTQSNRGDLLYADTSALDGAMAGSPVDLRSQMANFTAPFPVEAVGLGARWTATSQIDAAPLSMVQTSTYEITAIEGNVIRLATKVDMSLAPGTSASSPR